MNIVRGDLLLLGMSGEFDVIIHGCNCFNTMGAGIAKSMKTLFPEAYAADLTTERGAFEKLGTYTSAVIDCYVDGSTVLNHSTETSLSVSDRTSLRHHGLTVINAYTQWRPANNPNSEGPHQSLVDYDAIRLVFRRIKAQFGGKKLAYPLIGAGIAGGDWNVIAQIINEELRGEDHTLVLFSTDPNPA